MAELKYTIIAFGAGQCSSVLPFMCDWLEPIKYDEIVFCDTGEELPMTYEHIAIMKKLFKITTIKTQYKKSHPPFCTKDAKILPTRRYMRDKGVTELVQYLGITVEEKKRTKPPSVKWVTNKYPLIEAGFTRKDCQKYLLDTLGYVPPRSGCINCNYFDRQHLVTPYIKENKDEIYHTRTPN